MSHFVRNKIDHLAVYPNASANLKAFCPFLTSAALRQSLRLSTSAPFARRVEYLAYVTYQK